jgi:hypothetical protein
LPRRPARQQHTGNVDAGDEQEQSHHGHQHQQRLRESIAKHREPRTRRVHFNLQLSNQRILAAPGFFFEGELKQHGHLNVRLLDGHARLKASHQSQSRAIRSWAR